MNPLTNTRVDLKISDLEILKKEVAKLNRRVNSYLVQNGEKKRAVESLLHETDALGLWAEEYSQSPLAKKIQQIGSKIGYISNVEEFNRQIPLTPELKFINRHRVAHHLSLIRVLSSIRIAVEGALHFFQNFSKSAYYRGLASSKKSQIENAKRELKKLQLKCQQDELNSISSTSSKSGISQVEKKLQSLMREFIVLHASALKYKTERDVRKAAKEANSAYQRGDRALSELDRVTRDLEKTIQLVSSYRPQKSTDRVYAELCAELEFRGNLEEQSENAMRSLIGEARQKQAALDWYLKSLRETNGVLIDLARQQTPFKKQRVALKT